MKLNILILLLAGVILYSLSLRVAAKTIEVPADFGNIQQAIDSSNHGDTILVDPGIYSENIIFRGKNIVLTSRYLIEENYDLIFSTIIDGSSPEYPDSASCVRFMNGEDSTAVLEGFTITGGSGTVHPDVDPNYIWREGGGILAYYASPTIRNNYITGNESDDASGITGAGGGGVAFFKGHNPYLINNIITFNAANDYAPGVSIDKSGGTLKNNIIARNSGADTYGGGGIWVLETGSYPVFIENNTVIWNESGQSGAGLYVWNGDVTAINNIFWGNEHNNQVRLNSGSLILSYSLVENGYSSGENIVDDNPQFFNDELFLSDDSPAVDAGAQLEQYNDPEDPSDIGHALFPAMESIINDLGAFGGPLCLKFSIVIESLPEPPSAIKSVDPEMGSDFYTYAIDGQLYLRYSAMPVGSIIDQYQLNGSLIKSNKTFLSEGEVLLGSSCFPQPVILRVSSGNSNRAILVPAY